MNKLISTQTRALISLVDPSETGQLQLIYKWPKLKPFNQKLTIFIFNQHPQLISRSMQNNWKAWICSRSELRLKTTVWSFWFSLTFHVKQYVCPPTVISYVTCRLEHTTENITEQAVDPSLHSFLSPSGSSVWSIWTTYSLNFSLYNCYNCFLVSANFHSFLGIQIVFPYSYATA